MTTDKRVKLVSGIETLINQLSLESGSDTPDHILAEYMVSCLESYQEAVRSRDKWFGVDMWSANKLATSKESPNDQ